MVSILLPEHFDLIKEDALAHLPNLKRIVFTSTTILPRPDRAAYQLPIVDIAANPRFVVSKELKEKYKELDWVKELGFNVVSPVTVSFDTDGAASIASIQVDEGTPCTEPSKPTKDVYRFLEWQLDGHSYSFDLPVFTDNTLKATWKKQEKMLDITHGVSHEISPELSTPAEASSLGSPRLYPLSASTQLTLEAARPIAHYKVLSSSGKNLLYGDPGIELCHIDVAPLADRAYFLHLEDKDGHTSTRCVVVAH